MLNWYTIEQCDNIELVCEIGVFKIVVDCSDPDGPFEWCINPDDITDDYFAAGEAKTIEKAKTAAIKKLTKICNNTLEKINMKQCNEPAI